MSTAKFFTYKGHLACEIDMNGKFINDPRAKGQLGCVIETAEVQMTTDAKKMIVNARVRKSFALSHTRRPMLPSDGRR